jgi:predicted ATPase
LAPDGASAVGLARALRREAVWDQARHAARVAGDDLPVARLAEKRLEPADRAALRGGNVAHAAAMVRRHGDETGNESLVAMWPGMADADVVFSLGRPNEVEWAMDVAARLIETRDRAATVVHNHPTDTPLSSADLDLLLSVPGIGEIHAYGPHGVSIARARAGLRNGEINDLHARVVKPMIGRREVHHMDAYEGFVVALEEAGFLTERRELDNASSRWVDEPSARAFIDTIVGELAKLQKRPLDAEFTRLPAHDRSARVGGPGGMAPLSAGDEGPVAADGPDPLGDRPRGGGDQGPGGARRRGGRALADAARRVAESLGADDFGLVAGDLWSAARDLRGYEEISAPEDFAAALAREIDDVSPAARTILRDPAQISELRQLLDDRADAAAILASPAYQAIEAHVVSQTPTISGPDVDLSRRSYVIDGRPATFVEVEAYLPKMFIADGVGEDRLRIERRAVIVTGYPGSGKSTATGRLADALGAAVVDGDRVKTLIPEYRGGVGTQAVHLESSLLRLGAMGALRDRGVNLVLERVGDDRAAMAAFAQSLTKAGYRVDVVFVDVTADEAVRRMTRRFLASGRYIEASFFTSVMGKPPAVFVDMQGDPVYTSLTRIDANGPPDQAIIADAIGAPDVAAALAARGIGRREQSAGRPVGRSSSGELGSVPGDDGAGSSGSGQAGERSTNLTLPPRLAARDPTLSDLVDELAAARADLDDAEAQGLIDAATAAAARADSPELAQLTARTELARAAAFCLTHGA